MRSINPATEEAFAEYPDDSSEAVRTKLAKADEAFKKWRRESLQARALLMRRVGALLRQRVVELAILMAREMGKPVTAGHEEIEKCAGACDHFAERGAGYLAPRDIPSEATRSGVRYEPLGAVLAIMPWNFPFWQVFRFAAPALIAGNVALLKHAPNVPGCALAIEALFRDAGCLEGVFQSLLIDAIDTQRVIEDPIVAAVTLTGSERAGRSVAAIAGRALKKTVLELGGSDAFIVLPDAPIEATARAAASARCINSGQSCIAAKRFIVVGDSRRFEAALAAALTSIRVGDPLDPKTINGPLARLDLLENLQDQVDRSLALGARLVTGGKRLPRLGYFYPPTLVADVVPGMPLFDEETFGPVAALIRARDVEHAISLANQTRLGLGASVWTGDATLAERTIVPRLEAGSVFINGPVRSEPALPFGGVKDSGYGRELSEEGMREFVNVKTVWVK